MRMICSKRPEVLYGMVVLAAACGLAPPNLALAQKPQKKLAEVSHPPKLPGGVESLTITGPELLKPTETLLPGVEIAKTPPTVDVLYYPGQDYPGNPWSVWGDSVATPGKYYSSFGDHISPAGNAYVFEYDAATKKFRKLFQVTETLKTAEGHYRPGKIHGRLDFGADGRLYFATHRGSERTTNDDYHFQGDWIIAADPQTAKAEIIAHAPLAKHCIPNSMVDGERMIFYGGTAPGRDAEVKDIMFFAYDLKNRKLLYSGANGPSRAMMLAKSTGRVYFTGGEAGKADGQLLRFDPAQPGTPVALPIRMGLRAASDETKEGKIYAVSQNPGKETTLYEFDTKTETLKTLGAAEVAGENYIVSLDVDAAGRYMYYIPGAHGGGEKDGSAVVQYDLKTNKKKVIAFLHPTTEIKAGVTMRGTFGSALDPAGDKLYITWNANRESWPWDTAALTVIHIPASERQ